jgi:hypothetical protein
MRWPPRRAGRSGRTGRPGAGWCPLLYLGWIILGCILTWAAVELNMLQRLLDTTSLSGRQWIVVIALSLLAPAVVAVDKLIQLRRQGKASVRAGAELKVGPAAVQVST